MITMKRLTVYTSFDRIINASVFNYSSSNSKASLILDNQGPFLDRDLAKGRNHIYNRTGECNKVYSQFYFILHIITLRFGCILHL
ncbi:hypothetical protein D3C73_1367930 [compost metagenome]